MGVDDYRHLYSALRMGLWGPYGSYRQSYYILAKQNETSEILRATAMGKKFKPTPFASYHELFEDVENAESLGFGTAAREKRKSQNLAQRAVMALGGDIPAWISEIA
ncbi:hypothetical protein [Acinetobacter sp.]|uniref:hypothetical protein n=1 Tax=Acinetobacter sp. TaxID=472 RepID=UPI003919B0EF